jgi:SpoIID/LytB domain protein
MKEPNVSVCILQDCEILFNLNGEFTAKGNIVSGQQSVLCVDGCISWNGVLYQELIFQPISKINSFDIFNVRIGINFHWERKQTQTFKGSIKMIVNDGKICVVNLINVEDYLNSVISSEMSANAPLEFLKAHAVISRSWLFAQMDKRKKMRKNQQNNSFFSFIKSDDSLIRWYGRQDHTLFDVCADDHCQRYQGINKINNTAVQQAIQQTRGQIITYNGTICDARFSKCCGGIMEQYQACWEDVDYPYLAPVRDWLPIDDEYEDSDLTVEENAKKWIENQPDAFCNTNDKRILSLVLNSYDQETNNFYRWKTELTQEKAAQLINSKTKIDFGDIIDLIPIKRGRSARVILLKIVGTKRTFTIGKELEIRRVLSDSHLLSSAFIVKKVFDNSVSNIIPLKFILCGAGWGHGVGLCQIGAAVMSDKGFNYRQILEHYYPSALITNMYD